MNRIANHLTRATMIAAVLAAGFTAVAAHAADREVRIVQLPTVTIVAKRIRVVELPTVTIVAKRLAPEPVMVAQRAAHGAALKAGDKV
jgi:hypothetical protein